MNCPRCDERLPEAIGQHAVAPESRVIDCPNCGARVNLETGQLAEAGFRAEEQGGAPIQAGQPESFSGEETVEGVMSEIEEKDQ